jgi:hypothetical protein
VARARILGGPWRRTEGEEVADNTDGDSTRRVLSAKLTSEYQSLRVILVLTMHISVTVKTVFYFHCKSTATTATV